MPNSAYEDCVSLADQLADEVAEAIRLLPPIYLKTVRTVSMDIDQDFLDRLKRGEHLKDGQFLDI